MGDGFSAGETQEVDGPSPGAQKILSQRLASKWKPKGLEELGNEYIAVGDLFTAGFRGNGQRPEPRRGDHLLTLVWAAWRAESR